MEPSLALSISMSMPRRGKIENYDRILPVHIVGTESLIQATYVRMMIENIIPFYSDADHSLIDQSSDDLKT